MKTKIGLPLGLALVMFIGVFTTMLALGVMAPNTVQAVTGTGDDDEFEVALSNTIPGHYSDWSFTVKSTQDFVGADVVTNPNSPVAADTLSITFPAAIVLVDGDAAHESANWMLGGEPVAEVSVTVNDSAADVVTLTPQAAVAAVAAAAGSPAVEAVPPFKIEAGEDIKVEFTSPRKGPPPETRDITDGIPNPAATVALDERSDLTLSVVTTQDATAGVSATFSFDNTRVGQVTVTHDDMEPGQMNAEYQITFYVPEDLTADGDRIFVRFDKDITEPSSLDGANIRIQASAVTGDDAAIAGNSFSIQDPPTYSQVAVSYTHLTLPTNREV